MSLKRAIIIVIAVLLAIIGTLFFINNKNDLPKDLNKEESNQIKNIKNEENVYENEKTEAEKISNDKEENINTENLSEENKTISSKNNTNKTVKKINTSKVKSVSVKETDKKTSQTVAESEDDSNVLKESVYKDNAIEIKQLFKPTKDYKVVFQDKVYLIRLRKPVIQEIPQTTVEQEEAGIVVGE